MGSHSGSDREGAARRGVERPNSMDRLFGKANPAAPKPTLQDANDSMAKRGENLDTKIQKLDQELARYTDQLKKMKPGPVNQQFNIDQIQFAQESLKETATTVAAMKDANKE